MFPIGQHPIFPHTEEDRQEVFKYINIKESDLEECVTIITDWFYKQPHLAEAGISANMIKIYLISTRGSVERAKQSIDAYYKHRLNFPEFFKARIQLLNTDRPIWHTHIYAPILKLYKGIRVLVLKVTDPEKFKIEDMIINLLMGTDIRLMDDFIAGDIWIVDEGIRDRIFNIHVLNCSISNIAETMITLLKPLLSKKIYERIKFHKCKEDLHQYVPKEYLPKDYGGDCPPLEEFRDKMENFMREANTKKMLIEACKMVTDESKRPKPNYDPDNLSGTFKNLAID